jgi:N-acyl-D-aspartate/D-glutamate deacylase
MRLMGLATALAMSASVALATPYDIIINNGRVIDPESGTDFIADVGIRGGRIVEIGTNLTSATEIIDATGLIVTAGFIDLHSHAIFSDAGQLYQLYDGVTTALELEAGAHPVADALDRFADGARINIGSAAGYLNARLDVKDGISRVHIGDQGLALSGIHGLYGVARSALGYPLMAMYEPADDTEIDALLAAMAEDLEAGAIGISVLADYMSEALSPHELKRIFEFAAARNQIIFTHMRRPPIQGDTSGLEEMIRLAEETGAGVHICHINSNATNAITEFLALVVDAQRRGVDITAEVYPYLASSTFIGANAYGRDWRRMYGTDYWDIEDPATGERMTEASFLALRESDPEHIIIQHYAQPEWLREGVAMNGIMIASDAMSKPTMDFRVHPRGAGTFTRVVGPLVREGVLSLNDAIAKMTLLPAQRLQTIAPAFAHKGRLRPGMDADIVIFDAATISDQATYADPNQFSTGIAHVLIGGEFALKDGAALEEARVGRVIRATEP